MGEQAQQAHISAVVESCEDRDLAGVCALQKPVEVRFRPRDRHLMIACHQETSDLTRRASDLAKLPSGMKDEPTRTQALGGASCRSRGVIF